MISSLELARRCGISQGTVDRALHNRAGVSAKTKELVLRIAQQQGYRPHPGARELLTGESRMVGAIVPTVNNVFFMDVLNELARSLAERDLRLQLTPVLDRAGFLEMLEDFAGRRYRLAVVIPPEDGIPISKSIAAGLPIVSLISPCQGTNTQFLSPDEASVGRDAVNYLHGRGHHRILHLTYDRRSYAVQARAKGYRDECARRKLKAQIQIGTDPGKIKDAIQRFQPTAIFCHNDWMAVQLLLLLSKLGVRSPDDISVLGVDNSPTLMTIYPELTTMAYPLPAALAAIARVLTGKPANLEKERYRVVERSTVATLR